MLSFPRVRRSEKKDVPPIQKPTVSFYSRKGMVDQLEGANVFNSRRKGPFLMASTPEGLPVVADYIQARYAPHNGGWEASYIVFWSDRDTGTKDLVFMESIGYPVALAGRGAESDLRLGWFPAVRDVQQAIRDDVARRFVVTSEWPTVLWLFAHS